MKRNLIFTTLTLTALSMNVQADHYDESTVKPMDMSQTKTIQLIGHPPSDEQVKAVQETINKIKAENTVKNAELERRMDNSAPVPWIPEQPIRVIIVKQPYQQ